MASPEFANLAPAAMADASLLGRTFLRGEKEAKSAPLALTTDAADVAPIVGLVPLNANFDDVNAMQSHFDRNQFCTLGRVSSL